MAAPIVLREFIVEALAAGDSKAATSTIAGPFDYLRWHYDGRDAHRHIEHDPLDVLRHFLDDDRLDSRYRALTLSNMIAQIERRRTPVGRLMSAIGIGGSGPKTPRED